MFNLFKHDLKLISAASRKFYTNYSRGNYQILNDKNLKYFESILGKDRCITDDSVLKAHNVDWMNKYKGSSKLLLQPKTSEEVSLILKYCNDKC